jgi:hypothetical protein
MKTNFKNIPFFLSVTLVLSASFLYMFVYFQVEKNSTQAEEKMTTWQTELKRREDIKSLDRSIKEVEGAKISLESHFAKNSDVVPFLNTVEGLSEKVSATPEIISVEASEDLSFLRVEMRAEGTFESLYKFLTLLENSPYELEFLSVNLSRPSGQNEASDWEIHLRFKLLSFIK